MVSRIARLCVSLSLMCASGSAFARGYDPCTDILPSSPGAWARRALTPDDLVQLRDIGPVDPFVQRAHLFAVSPDGKRVAFQLRRADPAHNRYCLAMVVLELTPGADPAIIDSGGEFIRVRFDFRGKAGFPSGIAQAITPRWSPDGRWIAFLKKQRDTVQVWRSAADGGASTPLTASIADVEDFRIGTDGRTLIFASRPGLAAADHAITQEGLSGFRYDDRYSPMSGDRPFPVAPIPQAVFVQDLSTGEVRPASDSEAAQLNNRGVREDDQSETRGPGGRSIRLDPGAGALRQGTGNLVVEGGGMSPLRCQHPLCQQARRPWWTSDGRIRFFATEGWADASTAIYEWSPGANIPRRLYVTDDVLVDCVPHGEALLCLREGSSTPRRLERLDPASGIRKTIFDPNPEFANLALGRVERLHLTNAFGLQSIADLVLPTGYRPGTPYPLVVVQYDTRGFLRGGTGDEYPIQAFANRGYAVLSFSRPRSIGRQPGVTDYVEVARRDLAKFADRRSILSSLEAGVRVAVARGIADPSRLGITGMSDGTSTAVFALLHTRLFSAAAISNCCIDTMFPTRVGPAAAREFRHMGYPALSDRSRAADAFWAQISLARNAVRLSTPILIHAADDELMSALESYTALKEAGAPVDMLVFPGEHHVKWQPAHRLASYRRSLDWFDYWLRGTRSTSAGRQADITHWDALTRLQSARREP